MAFKIPVDGISKFASALMGGDYAYQEGFNKEQERQSKLAQVLANTNLEKMKTTEIGAALERQKPDNVLASQLPSFGIPTDSIGDVQNYFKTGSLGSKYETPAYDGVGPSVPKPEWSSRIPQLAAAMRPLTNALTLGDKNSENVASATGKFREQQVFDNALAGGQDLELLNKVKYAIKGDAPFKSDEYGVMNNLTGKLDVSNPAAVNLANKRLSEILEKKAKATKLDREKETVDKGTLQQTENGLVRVIGNTATPVTGADGVPIKGKSTKSEAVTEGERKAATLLQRLEGSEKQLNAALAEKPDAAKPGLVASAMRSIGAEALANSTAVSPERQRIEAAQMDMLDAALTLGTGAAYTKEQLEGYRKSYFPQIGDDETNIADKKERLANVIEAAKIAAGRAASKTSGAKDALKSPNGDGQTGLSKSGKPIVMRNGRWEYQ